MGEIIFHESQIKAAPEKKWRHSFNLASLFKQAPPSPPVRDEVARLSCDVLQAQFLIPLRVSLALWPLPGDPLLLQSRSSPVSPVSPVADDAPAYKDLKVHFEIFVTADNVENYNTKKQIFIVVSLDGLTEP